MRRLHYLGIFYLEKKLLLLTFLKIYRKYVFIIKKIQSERNSRKCSKSYNCSISGRRVYSVGAYVPDKILNSMLHPMIKKISCGGQTPTRFLDLDVLWCLICPRGRKLNTVVAKSTPNKQNPLPAFALRSDNFIGLGLLPWDITWRKYYCYHQNTRLLWCHPIN